MNTKKILAGVMALSLTAALTACGGGNGADSETTTSEATTTTKATVAVNTEGLKDEEQESLSSVLDQLPDTELANKEIKWLAHYDLNPSNDGSSKKVELELFEQKYGGKITYIPTTWEKRYDDLSTNVLGGTGVDFFPGDDANNYPKGIINGMFQSVDDYIDLDSAIWQNVSNAMDLFKFGGKHYQFVTGVTAEQVVIYDTSTLEAQGFDDPWELYQKGEWNWDTFKQMLLDFVDPDADQYGLDGWFNEKPLMLTCGVAPVELRDGQLVSNLYDERLEKSMNFMYELSQNGLVLDKSLFDWSEHPEFIGEGKELFYICGAYTLEGSPDIWNPKFGSSEDVMFVPVPKMDDADEYYLPAGLEAYMLCKGAQNPEGVARFMECILAANSDTGSLEIADRKRKDDYGWTDDMIQMRYRINEMTAEHPMYSIHTGCPTDMYNILDSGEYGIRAAFYGHDWPSVRDSLADAVNVLIDEFNESLDSVE